MIRMNNPRRKNDYPPREICFPRMENLSYTPTGCFIKKRKQKKIPVSVSYTDC